MNAYKHHALIYGESTREYEFKYPCTRIVECNGITATLLTSPFLLTQEGVEMHHCVGSYHDDVDSGSSIIFSLIDQEKVRSTLELSFIKNKWRVVQNKGTWNHQVAASFDAAALQVAKVQNEFLRSIKKQSKHTRIEAQ